MTIGPSPEKPSEKNSKQNKLTPLEDVAATLDAGMSFNSRIKFSNAIKKAGFDFLPSKWSFYQTKKRITRRMQLEWIDGQLICSNAKQILEDRLAALGGKNEY